MFSICIIVLYNLYYNFNFTYKCYVWSVLETFDSEYLQIQSLLQYSLSGGFNAVVDGMSALATRKLHRPMNSKLQCILCCDTCHIQLSVYSTPCIFT